MHFKLSFMHTIAIGKFIVITMEANDTMQQIEVVVNLQLPNNGAVQEKLLTVSVFYLNFLEVQK